MTDFVPEPRDRLEVPICKAIEAKDYKQALKLVEKRSAKVSDSHLQALRCFILCCHPIITERGKGLAAIIELQKSFGKAHTAAELDIYDEALKHVFPTRWMQESVAICELRVKAVIASPADENLAVACFRACLKADNLDCAQLIANSLERHFVSNHNYQFWAITTQALFSVSSTCPPKKAQIMSSIAFKKIKALASSTVNAKGAPSVRSLQTPQELLLFHRLLASQTGDDEALKICSEDILGPASKIAKGEWIIRIKQLQVLQRREEWNELFTTCHTLLEASRSNNSLGTISDARGADWFVWKGFLLAVSMIDTVEAISAVSNELEAHLDKNSGLDKTYRRNASLASVAFGFLTAPEFLPKISDENKNYSKNDSKLRKAPRVLAIWLHLYRYGHTASAFTDVKAFLERLNLEEMKVFVEELPCFLNHTINYLAFEKWKFQKSNPSGIKDKLPPPPYVCDWDEITSGITQSKIEFLIKSSMAESDRTLRLQQLQGTLLACDWCSSLCETVCLSCLGIISKDSLQAYGWAVEHNAHIRKFLKSTDKHPADEWVIIAAQCLMKAAGCKPWHSEAKSAYTPTLIVPQLLQAAVILEFAHSHSKANPQISILLVRLYALLGAGSLAMRAYNRLGVKQIQGDTLSYLLFDRISSLHPHSVADGSNGSTKILDPSIQLKRLQRLYRSFKDQITSNAWRSFENGNYDSIFQLMEVSERLSNSIALAISAIELRKIDRIVRPEVVLNRESHGYDLLAQQPIETDYVNNADCSSFPNYESSNNAAFELYTRIGPSPSQLRSAAFFLIEELWMFVLSSSESRTGQSVAKVGLSRMAIPAIQIRQRARDSGYFTQSEKDLIEIGSILTTIILHAVNPDMAEVDKRPDLITEFCHTARQKVDAIISNIANAFKEGCEDDWIPMFITTLHPLYSAHEAANLIITGMDYLSSSKLWVSPGITEAISRLKNQAANLKILVVQKGMMVRSRVNNGQWLDRVLGFLNSDLPNQGPRSSDITNQTQESVSRSETLDWSSNGSYQPLEDRSNSPNSKNSPAFTYQGMGELLSEVIPEEFLEHWAGEIVDSWRESTMGLACLKSD